MQALAQAVGEQTLFNRTGGAPAFAVGMAHIFSHSIGGQALMAIWYHFAIMFEALFILTVLDAGTRVGRFMVQDALGPCLEAAGPHQLVSQHSGQQRADRRRLGIFSVAGREGSAGRHQFALAAVRHFQPVAGDGRAVRRHHHHHQDGPGALRRRYPGTPFWLVAVTFSASYYKIFDPNPRIGFLAHARQLAMPRERIRTAATARLIFNDRLDAAVTGILIVMVAMILIESAAEWIRILAGRKQPVVRESPSWPPALLPRSRHD